MAIATALVTAFVLPQPRCPCHMHPRRALRPPRMAADDDEVGGSLALLGGALVRAEAREERREWRFVGDEGAGSWLFLPPSTPWAVVHFVGGAALGAVPQLCYDGLLRGLATRANVAILATPYELKRDHGAIAADIAGGFGAALESCIDTGVVPSSAKFFSLGHSLGAKLLLIGACESGSEAPLGLLAFNNYRVADSVALAAETVQQLQGGARGDQTAGFIKQAFAVAEQLGATQQLEFTPSADELYASVREAGDDLGPVTCWKFGDDTIDCSDALADALPAGGASTTVPLAGTHLTPVFFKLSATDVDPRLGALLGDVTYTLGDDAAIETLVDALTEWVWPMSKKPPTARVLEASS